MEMNEVENKVRTLARRQSVSPTNVPGQAAARLFRRQAQATEELYDRIRSWRCECPRHLVFAAPGESREWKLPDLRMHHVPHATDETDDETEKEDDGRGRYYVSA